MNIPSDERVRWFRCESGFRFRLEINEDYKYKVSIFISFKFLFYSIGVKFNSSELMMPVRWISYHDIGSRRSWGMSSTAEPSWSQIEDQIITRRYQMNHMTKTHWFILWLEREFNLLFTGEPIKISFGIPFLSDAWHFLNRSHTKLIDKISRNRQAASHHQKFDTLRMSLFSAMNILWARFSRKTLGTYEVKFIDASLKWNRLTILDLAELRMLD